MIEHNRSPTVVLVFLFLPLRGQSQNLLHVRTVNRQCPHLIPRRTVFRIRRFLLCQQFCIFRQQTFDGRQLFQTWLVKRFFRGFDLLRQRIIPGVA